MNMETRVRKLEAAASESGPKVVVLFGDDRVPEAATEHTVILRFDEEDRGL